ncbi:MAG: hypothetical protein ACYTF8_00065 [Planctomycetota bacterium]
MSQRMATAALLAVLLAGCSSSSGGGTQGLETWELDFLWEDVTDLVTIGFQAAENAYVGDPVQPGDVIEDAAPSNGHTVIYALPEADRVGLGLGSGSVALHVTEDGVVNTDPLGFSIDTTTALVVEIDYDLDYLGTAWTGRLTDVLFIVYVTATRASAADPFDVEYNIVGDCFLGETYCEWDALFAALGRPRDGIVEGFGDAIVTIDDPDIFDFYLPLFDWRIDHFRTRGPVGCCSLYEDHIPYTDVIQ